MSVLSEVQFERLRTEVDQVGIAEPGTLASSNKA